MSAFTVKVIGAKQYSSGVSVSGQVVSLTLSRGASDSDTFTVSYTVPSSKPIQDAVGNDVASLTNQAVTNDTADTTAPRPSSAAVDGTALTLTFNEVLDAASKPAASAFAVSVAGSSRTVSGVAIAGSAVTLTLSAAAGEGQT